jgi:hypothetical protein
MSETAIVTDASLEETPTNAPLSGNEEGVDNQGDQSDDQPVDPRLAIMEQIADRNNEERAIEPGSMKQEDMPAGEPVPEVEPTDEVIESGLANQETFGEEEGEPEGLPQEYADDPLAEFIEMEGDEPMFRTVVNGQQQLIPLEKARADLQKNVAADQRLREAAQVQASLEDREKAIAAREAELAAKLQGMHTAATPPEEGEEPQTGESLTEEARSVVKELFTGSEEDAAAKLADLLLKNRGAAQVSTSMDPAAIAQAAVAAARQELSAEAQQRDVQKGFKKFTEDYPEIAADDNLFAFADGLTSKIEAEHPDWMPSEVMLEAGKRTREWVESQKGDENTSEQDPAQNDRTERKRKLRRVPRARQGAEPKEETPEETPGSYLAELRQQRGLPD